MANLILESLIILIVCHQIFSEDRLTLPELLASPPEQSYFDKYGPCSISGSRMNDAYTVEGKLAATVIKGLINIKFKNYDKDYSDMDDALNIVMQNIIEKRDSENVTSNFTNNPINALHFLSRIVTDFNPILDNIFKSEKLMKRRFHKDLSSVVDQSIREECLCWPTARDLNFAVKSLSRISSTYRLPKDNLTAGYIYHQRSFEPLSTNEAVALSQESNRNNFFEDVLDWVQFLLNNKEIQSDKDQLRWLGLIKIKAGVFFKRNQVDDAISILQTAIKEAKSDTKILMRDLNFYKSKKEDNKTPSPDENKIEHSALCRNNSQFHKNIFSCHYRQIGTSWDRVKVEIISRNPPVFKYHRIISDNEIFHLLNLVKSLKMKMSTHHVKEQIFDDTKFLREIATVWDDDHRITRHLNKRINFLTGLEVKTSKHNDKMSASTPFKIINYGIGGFVESHTDYLDQKKTGIPSFAGDRMATWMYHLSDNVQGGQIVFVKSNITVSLEKGSGLLLFNIFKNGTTNPQSEYMECPVITGSKWVGTKYINENGNMFARKCPRIKRSFF